MSDVITIYRNFANRGGAQDVALKLAMEFSQSKVVLTSTPLDKIHDSYKNQEYDYRKLNLRNIKALSGNTFISHDRKSTSYLMLIKKLFGLNLKIVHVAHNTFSNLKIITWLPKNVVAVSEAVKVNLVDYFKVNPDNVTVIPNGIEDNGYVEPRNGSECINILLPARINDVKQQVAIVEATKPSLPNWIHIDFAGEGSDVELLKDKIAGDSRYSYIGFVNLNDVIANYDYVMLFSKNEGQPLTLINGAMYGKPLITNSIPAVLTVNEQGKTGFVFENLNELADGLQHICWPDEEEYKQLSVGAREKYEKYFTNSMMIDRYRKVLEQL